MVFYLLFLVLTLAYIVYDGNRTLVTKFIIMSFIIIGGLRDNVGSDWTSYYWSYMDELQMDTFVWNDFRDPLFYYIEHLFTLVFKTPYPFFFTIFCISFLLKYTAIKCTNRLNIYFALLIYLSGIFLIFDINGIRQGLAMGITLYSTKYILRKEIVKFVVLILCSSLIHHSSIVFLFAYPLFQLKIQFNAKQYIWLTFIAIASGIIISNSVADYIGIVLGEDYSNHYSYYTEGDAGYLARVTLFGMSSLRKYFLWGIILFFTKNDNSDEIRFYKNCMVVSFFLFFLMSHSLEVSYRLSYYYSMFELILIPMSITSIKYNKTRFLVASITIMFYFYLTFKLVSNPFGKLDIYENVLL